VGLIGVGVEVLTLGVEFGVLAVGMDVERLTG
jgi:hypothetical protein